MESVPTPGDMVGAKDPEKIKAAVAFLKFETTAENQIKGIGNGRITACIK